MDHECALCVHRTRIVKKYEDKAGFTILTLCMHCGRLQQKVIIPAIDGETLVPTVETITLRENDTKRASG